MSTREAAAVPGPIRVEYGDRNKERPPRGPRRSFQAAERVKAAWLENNPAPYLLHHLFRGIADGDQVIDFRLVDIAASYHFTA